VTTPNMPSSTAVSLLRRLRAAAAGLCVASVAFIAACGGGADAPPPPEGALPPAALAPVITQQPADLTVVSGQPATFTVAATGTAPLAYQWQRNGADIAGATSTTYAISASAPTDTGAVFRAVVANAAGTATSNNATLTVTTAPPVLTITQQPANVTVTAGASATFTVAATCSSGTLQIQWQRLGGSAFADIAGATTPSYSLTAASTDNAAQFRANLSCSGQSATASQTATLTVGAPSSITLGALTLNGVGRPAAVGTSSIVRLGNGDFVFASADGRLKRLNADLTSITIYSGVVATSSGAPIDGAAAVATYNGDMRITIAANDVIYVADRVNQIVRRVAADGSVATIAGTAGQSGLTDGTGAAARFNSLDTLAVGPDGDVYLTDTFVIRRMTPAGVVTTYAGSGTLGASDGPAGSATFDNFRGITAAPNGDLYVASNNKVRRILRSGNVAGNVETLAGSGSGTSPGVDGTGTAASLPGAQGLWLSGSTLYFLDQTRLRALDVNTRVVTTFSGSTTGNASFIDGPASTAQFNGGRGSLVAIPSGGFMVADSGAIRQVDATGTVTTIAANNASSEGTAVLKNTAFSFATNNAQTLTADGRGNVFVFSQSDREVRRIDSAGNVSIAAGLTIGTAGNIDGIGTAAQFASYGSALAVAPDSTLYASDRYGIRRIGVDNAVTMYAGSATQSGFADGDRTTGRFGVVPNAFAVAPNGDVFVTDGSFRIRRVDATGTITTYAGSISQSAVIDGPLATARFRNPTKLAFAPDGTLYVSDGSSLRKITTDGNVSTVAGAPGLGGGMVVDATGTVYGLSNGLYSVTPAGVATLLVPAGDDLVLGNVSPVIGRAIDGLGLYGAKQLVLFTFIGQGVLVTLP
jgi:hypothetical protein